MPAPTVWQWGCRCQERNIKPTIYYFLPFIFLDIIFLALCIPDLLIIGDSTNCKNTALICKCSGFWSLNLKIAHFYPFHRFHIKFLTGRQKFRFLFIISSDNKHALIKIYKAMTSSWLLKVRQVLNIKTFIIFFHYY